MALKQSFFDLLEHIGTTSTTSALCHASPDTNIVAMRHDVDHDLELALEMAHHEWRLGYKATYFLLHTESYWNDEKFPLLVRQLKEYGHEIGLHVNSYSSWITGQCNDPNLEIKNALGRLRECGVEVSGVCAHGDKLCYKHGYINYWMWKELRGDNPEVTEEGMSAEGIRVSDEAYQIPYPINHSLVREDGQAVSLWNLSMTKHAIEYDAAHLSQDHYWSDSGGKWTRTGSPMESDLTTGRHQVLVHPWWWRGETKSIFVLSPARSGSKWFANFIDKATSAVGLHEWTLNHVREGNEFPSDNQTSRDFLSLLKNPTEIITRMKAAKAHRKLFQRDVIECNVYLEGCIIEFFEVFENVDIVQLKRSPLEVTRSILNRRWYESTNDHIHRTDGSKLWDSAAQLERACRYVISANEAIESVATYKLDFNKMTQNQEYLSEYLSQWGIVVHPWLASQIYTQKLNANEAEQFPPLEQWPNSIIESVEQFFKDNNNTFPKISTTRDNLFQNIEGLNWKDCNCTRAHKKKSFLGFKMAGLHNQTATTVFFGCQWNSSNGGGVKISRGKEYRVSVSLKQPMCPVRVYALLYDSNGEIMHRLQLATLTRFHYILDLAFKPHAEASSFSIGLYIDKQTENWSAHVNSIGIQQREMPDQYGAIEAVCAQLNDTPKDAPAI